MKTTRLSTDDVQKLQDKINKSAVFGTMKTRVGNIVFDRRHTKESLLNHLIKLELSHKKPRRETTGITDD